MVTSPTAVEKRWAPTRSIRTSKSSEHTIPKATPKKTLYRTMPVYPDANGHRRWHTPLHDTAKLKKYWIRGLIHLVLPRKPVAGLTNMSTRAKMESRKAAEYSSIPWCLAYGARKTTGAKKPKNMTTLPTR